MKSATVIRHIAFEDLGTLEIALQRQGYIIKYLEAGVDDLTNIATLAEDMLIILGGPIGAYDEQDYPFLLDELRILERRLKADLPTLGICLGAQLMARALGARVYPGGKKEIGWSNITLSEAGKNSPLVNLNVDNPVLHWHGDTFDLPQGATRLASSSLYENQAFSYGRASMGLQFHPEVTQIGLERWFIGHASEINSTPGISVKQLRADTVKYGHLLQEQAVEVWENWLESVQLVY
ncbi:putative amidotransferase [Calothrix parasitica NIES-267]|uniref:Putative amidotransferase n=1 Tax=Calothrix parasitica NIES-267 TaxID=1973488 RepID=A0A1Z4LS65_9CYAN|nr:putative amidotransferase [Calothrix parasitica NIES-267]